ncbi:hypothetical protein VT55_004745 [Escherichia coli]|nr:hypothetical protein [Escherichia coli]
MENKDIRKSNLAFLLDEHKKSRVTLMQALPISLGLALLNSRKSPVKKALET